MGSDENSEADSDDELLLKRNLSLKKQTSSKILDTSSSDSDEGEKDLNLRKRDEKSRKEENILAVEKIRKEEKIKKEEKLSHKEKRKSFEKEKQSRRCHQTMVNQKSKGIGLCRNIVTR